MKCESYTVAVIGNVDSGKSSLIGTLKHGKLDDSRGSARTLIFRHAHERETGRTSSISANVVCFRSDGSQIIPRKPGKLITEAEQGPDVARRLELIDLAGEALSYVAGTERNQSPKAGVQQFFFAAGVDSLSEPLKILDIELYDALSQTQYATWIIMAGHERYLKTTVYGLTAYQPDIAIVVVGANMGVKKMTKEHLTVTIAMDIPIIVVVTKIDRCPKNVAKETMMDIRKVLKKFGRLPLLVKTEEQATQAANTFHSAKVAPIFPLSNVTGEGLDNLRKLLALAQPPRRCLLEDAAAHQVAVDKDMKSEPFAEVTINGAYQVPGVGFVVSGLVRSGAITTNQTLLYGPNRQGKFIPVLVRDIEIMRSRVTEASAGENASFAIRSLDKKEVINRNNHRKGMMLVSASADLAKHVTQEFEARVCILHHQTSIAPGYQPYVNLCTASQTAEIVSVKGQNEDNTLRTGERGLVRFRFLFSPEYVRPKSRFIFRAGQAKGVGKVVRVVGPETDQRVRVHA